MFPRSLILIALVLGHCVAAAQTETSLQELAKQYVNRGLNLYAAGRYDEAIELYRKGYDAKPHPEILYNLAQAYRLKGDKKTALDYYRRYIAGEPNGRGAPVASRWVSELESAIEKERVAEQETRRRDEEARRPEQEARRPEGGSPIVPAGATERPGGGSGKALRIAGLAGLASGLVLVGVGVKFGLDARNISDELSHQQGGWTDELLARHADGEAAERRMFIFVGAGAAVAVAGITLYLLGRRTPQADRVEVTPSLAPGGAAVQVRGRF